MKKTAMITCILLAFSLLLKAQDMPYVKNSSKTSVLPFLKKGYRPQIALALLGGVQNNRNFDASSATYGIELSLQCALLCTKRNYIRTQINIMRQEGSILKSTSLELNPHYKLIAHPSFELGIGPGIGVIFAKANNDNKMVFEYGLGASAIYYLRRVFIGIESRYMVTNKVDFIDTNKKPILSDNLNNLRSILKLGYKF